MPLFGVGPEGVEAMCDGGTRPEQHGAHGGQSLNLLLLFFGGLGQASLGLTVLCEPILQAQVILSELGTVPLSPLSPGPGPPRRCHLRAGIHRHS